MKIPKLFIDKNGVPMQGTFALADQQEVDGSQASAQSDPIDGSLIRIASVDTALRIVTGPAVTDEEELEASSTVGILIPAKEVLLLPIVPGHVVAVYGGTASICTVGE
jgi:hypothetical protein